MDHVDRIVAQWHAERPDLDVAPLALVGRLIRVSHLLNQRLGDELAEFELQPGWFDLLAALRRSGPPYELNPGELMEATMLSSGGMTKRLDRLVEAGLVDRRPDPDDRRGTRVRLTRRGKAVFDRALEAHLRNEERVLGTLKRADRRELDRLLRRLLEELE
jgi:DNA-binding MarR family transcriptional regulator